MSDFWLGFLFGWIFSVTLIVGLYTICFILDWRKNERR